MYYVRKMLSIIHNTSMRNLKDVQFSSDITTCERFYRSMNPMQPNNGDVMESRYWNPFIRKIQIFLCCSLLEHQISSVRSILSMMFGTISNRKFKKRKIL